MNCGSLINMQGVGKDYPLYVNGTERFRTLISLWRGTNNYQKFNALDDISLDIQRGESFGLVGENGAGKSTLLKIIAGVVKPSRGTVSTNGRIGALLELGAGFHPDNTGRENVFLAAALMGLSHGQVENRLEQILSFADIGEHIDQPIKHYSSGMVVRLGFAVATTMDPDILITDEVLAVGDESFQKKCSAWMERYLNNGGTLLLCSHSMFHIQKLCRHSMWLDHGRVRAAGDSADVVREYLAYHEAKTRSEEQAHQKLVVSEGYRVLSLELNGQIGEAAVSMLMGTNLIVSGTLRSPDDRQPVLALGILRGEGTAVYGLVSDMEESGPVALNRLRPGVFGFSLVFPRLSLLPGRYYVRAHAMDPEGLRLYDQIECRLEVLGTTRELGICRLAHVWQTRE